MAYTFWRRGSCAAALVLATLLTACADTYSRDDFTTAVVGKSEQEVTAKFGKPASIDDSGPDRTRWIYTRQTFDLGNQNRIDGKTMIIFEGPTGERHATKVEFG